MQRRVVITGATRGLGLAMAQAFLDEGYKVWGTYHQGHEAAQAFLSQERLKDRPLRLSSFDVAKSDQVKSFYQEVEKEWQGVDILINNAGIRKDQLLPLMSEEEWDQVMNSNLKGTFLMAQEAVKMMMGQRFGRIINISSIGASMALSGQANYAASKAGQIALTKSLAKEVAKKGITVNSLCPGFIDTELTQTLDPELKKQYAQSVPMKRFGKAIEVAHAALFLASDKASYITGTTLDIAGGL